MTPQQKLNKIKRECAYKTQFHLGFDKHWLIARVEQLESVLKQIDGALYPELVKKLYDALSTGPKPE